MIRILQIMDNVAVASGVSSLVMNLYKNIDRSKIQFDFLVCCKTDVSYEKQIVEMGGRIFYVGNPLSIKSLVSSVLNIRTFFKFNASCYNIVHLHSPTIAFFVLRYAKKCGVKNRIVHSHSTMMSESRIKTVINTFLISQIKKYANIFWGCSTEACEFLYGKEWIKHNEYTIINNAIDCKTFSFDLEKRLQLRKEFNCLEKNVFCHVSNFSPIKNLLFLTESIQQIIKQNKRAFFLFVGAGPSFDDVKKKVFDYGLEKNVFFVGKTDRVNDYLCASDGLLLPSLKEGLPVTVVEAQSCGLPCFISDTITREVDVCNVHYLPLENRVWQEALINFDPLDESVRLLNSLEFRKSKFSINAEAKRVEKMYLEMI